MTTFQKTLALALAVTSASLGHGAVIMTDAAFWKLTGVTGSTSLTVGNLYQAPFGSDAGGTGVAPNTPWASGTTLFLETTIDLTGYNLATVDYSIAIDNDYILTINGVVLPKVVHEGVATYSAPLILPDTIAGINTIDVQVIDRGANTYFGMNVTGTKVPDVSSTALLLGLAAGGVVGLRRKLVA